MRHLWMDLMSYAEDTRRRKPAKPIFRSEIRNRFSILFLVVPITNLCAPSRRKQTRLTNITAMLMPGFLLQLQQIKLRKGKQVISCVFRSMLLDFGQHTFYYRVENRSRFRMTHVLKLDSDFRLQKIGAGFQSRVPSALHQRRMRGKMLENVMRDQLSGAKQGEDVQRPAMLTDTPNCFDN